MPLIITTPFFKSGSPWDLAGASYSGKSFSATSVLTSPTGIVFKPDGNKVYFISPNTVYQYTLTTPWDASTASYDSKLKDVSTENQSSTGVAFSSDGTKLYTLDGLDDEVYQYTLSTPWDVSTASYASKFLSVTSQDTSPSAIAFKPDGTKLYVVGWSSDAVYQYTLTTPWDVSTASYDSKSGSVASEESFPTGIAFKPDGTKMFTIGFGTNTAYQYILSTPWDVSTANYDSKSKDVTAQGIAARDIQFSLDGTKMYMMNETDEAIFQYSL